MFMDLGSYLLMNSIKPEAPPAPDYAAATREGIMADIETLPLRRLIETASKAGAKVEYTDPRTGETKTADFAGLGDADLSRIALDFAVESSDKLAAAQLAQSEKYGVATVEQRRKELAASDPEGWAMREEMGATILDQLKQGSALDDTTKAQVTEAERAGAAARGNILGASSAAAEAMTVGDAGFRLFQQRLANAAAFMQGTTPQAQFSAIGGQTAMTPMGMQQGTTINPGAAANGWNAAAQKWGMGFAAEQYEFQNSPLTKMYDTFLAMVASTGGVGAGKAMG